MCICGLVFFSTRNTINGHGILTSKNLDAQVWAQVGTTGDGGGTSGGESGGTSGGGSSGGGTLYMGVCNSVSDGEDDERSSTDDNGNVVWQVTKTYDCKGNQNGAFCAGGAGSVIYFYTDKTKKTEAQKPIDKRLKMVVTCR